MPTVCISGGTGLIGKALTHLLIQKEYEVIVLSRQPPASGTYPKQRGVQYATWNIDKQTIDASAIQKADYIIHLAGAGVADQRWSRNRKIEIAETRVKGSELIVKALQEIPNSVKAVISASAIGWYGRDPAIPNPHPFAESAPSEDGFLGKTCQAWEDSIKPVKNSGMRLVILRTGIVLSNEGGAMTAFKKPVRFGIAAILGSGRQMISWIHMTDLCRLYLEAIENTNWEGVYNAVAPRPVDNKTLVISLAKMIKGKFFLPFYIPSFVLKIILGEMSIEVLKSTTVSAAKIRQAGFQFLYPALDAALPALMQVTEIIDGQIS